MRRTENINGTMTTIGGRIATLVLLVVPLFDRCGSAAPPLRSIDLGDEMADILR